MAKTKISEFSATPANNTDIDSINIAEGCAPSGINDAIRELMAQLKDWQSGTSNDPYVIGSSGSLTLNQGTANGVPYLNGSKVLTSGSALTFDGTDVTFQSAIKLLNSDGGGNKAILSTHLYGGSGSTGTLNLSSTYGNANQTRIKVGTGGAAVISFENDSVETMRLNSTGLGIGTSSPSYKCVVNGTSGTVGLGITGTHAANDNGIYYNLSAITGIYSPINAIVSATGSVNTTFGNSNTTNTGANSRLDMYVGGSGSGDPKITYTVSGVLNWCVGVDNSDSDKFKISGSDSPGTSDYLTIDTSGNLGFNSGYGSVATAYGTRAWVNFNGTGTVAIRGSANVSSITDNGVGDYTVNFTNSMPDTNYAFFAGAQANGVANGPMLDLFAVGATASARFRVFSQAAAAMDSPVCTFMAVR